jgi:hypothetical protein
MVIVCTTHTVVQRVRNPRDQLLEHQLNDQKLLVRKTLARLRLLRIQTLNTHRLED